MEINKKNNCLFAEYLDFINKKSSSIDYLIYHQTGALLIKDKFNSRSYYESNLKDELDRFILDQSNILKIISFLSKINKNIEVIWVGPHIESHVNFSDLNSFNNDNLVFGSEDNKITYIRSKSDITHFNMKSKRLVAVDIFNQILSEYA